MIQLIGELQTMSARVELRVVVEISIRVARDVRECLQVFVRPLPMAEGEEVKGDLSVGELDACVLEELIRRLEEVEALGAGLATLALGWLELGMPQNHLRDLEEDHLAAYGLDYAVRALQCRDEARLHLCCFHEILWHVIKQVDYEVIALGQVHQQVLGLREEEVLRIGHHHHLRLLQGGLEIVELHVVVVRKESDLDSLAGLTWQQLLLEHALDGAASVRQVPTFNCWLRHIEGEDVSGWHGRPVHVLVVRDEVDGAAVELGALFVVRPVPILLNRRVVVALGAVDVAAEGAHPFLPVLQPPHEGVDVGSAILAPDDRLVLEVHLGYFWLLAILALKY